METNIVVEVAYASPIPCLLTLKVPNGTTLISAVEQSGVLDLYPELQSNPLKLGIWSKECQPTVLLKNHDRIEIYRPVQITPAQARQKRLALKQKKKNKPIQ